MITDLYLKNGIRILVFIQGLSMATKALLLVLRVTPTFCAYFLLAGGYPQAGMRLFEEYPPYYPGIVFPFSSLCERFCFLLSMRAFVIYAASVLPVVAEFGFRVRGVRVSHFAETPELSCKIQLE